MCYKNTFILTNQTGLCFEKNIDNNHSQTVFYKYLSNREGKE